MCSSHSPLHPQRIRGGLQFMTVDELHGMEITSQLIQQISKQREAVVCQLVKLYSCTQSAFGGNGGGEEGRERGWGEEEVRIKRQRKEGGGESVDLFSAWECCILNWGYYYSMRAADKLGLILQQQLTAWQRWNVSSGLKVAVWAKIHS